MRNSLTKPQKSLKAGRDFLVYPVMREGGYVRYDVRKSRQVLRDCEMLIAGYGGRLSRRTMPRRLRAILRKSCSRFTVPDRSR
jgi:hypothetical protein